MRHTRAPFSIHNRCKTALVTLVLLFVLGSTLTVSAQTVGKSEIAAGLDILSTIRSDIEKNYFDTTYHGIDLGAKFKSAEDRIRRAKVLSDIFSTIARLLIEFEDSHLVFVPPERTASVHYGWLMQMIGDKCFVTSVEPNSDAEAKGLHTGDEIVNMDGYTVTRDNLWQLEYFYYALQPREGVRLAVKDPAGKARDLDIVTGLVNKVPVVGSLSNTQRVRRQLELEAAARRQRDRFIDIGQELTIWRMPAFDEGEAGSVDSLVAHAKKFKSLIIDLRGNGGGYVDMLKRLIANLIDHDIVAFDERRRKETKTIRISSRKAEAFRGKLVVLVDGESASAAEIFARLVQLEKRGTVIGDRTSGAVRVSKYFVHELGLVTGAEYGVGVTVADVIMPDGKSLEHNGVVPDELLLPTGADLAARRDPVLARAAAILGVELSPEQAGSFFHIEWRK